MALVRKPGLAAVLATVALPPREARKAPAKRRQTKVEEIERRIDEAWSRMTLETWKGIELEKSGPLLVGIWAKLHESTYGVKVAAELAADDGWMKATVAAKRVALRFGDLGTAIDFVNHSWRMERRNEQERRAGGHDTKWRLSWQNQFLRPGTITDFEVQRKRG